MNQPQNHPDIPKPKQSVSQEPSVISTSSVQSHLDPEGGPAPPAHQDLAGYARRGMPAWLLSMLLHSAICVALLFLLGRGSNGASEVDGKSGGIVLVDASSESTEYLDEGDLEEAAASASTDAATESPPPLEAQTESAPDLPGLDVNPIEVSGAGETLVDILPTTESLIDGPAIRTGEVGGAVTTEVFGIKGTGSRFVYVFDRSKSMDGYEGRPMIAARQELIRSLQSLSESHQFQIIFYNDRTRIFQRNGQAQMFFASDDNKRFAEEFVNRTQPDSGTDHMLALKAAFRMAPDVVFLLTDAEGGFTPQELKNLRNLNRGGAVINAIQFGERRQRDRSLEQVAADTGGSYLFKNIQSLRIGR